MIFFNLFFCTALANQIQLENFNNIVFFMPAEIHKKVRFIIDTGSSRTVVPQNFTQSPTYTYIGETVIQKYDSGTCEGSLGKDDIILLDDYKLTIRSFKMLYAQCKDLPFYSTSIGLMGLSANKNQINIFESSGLINSIFGLELRKQGKSQLIYNQSYQNFENLNWYKSELDNKWMIQIIGIYFDNRDIGISQLGFIDSGYSCLILPQDSYILLLQILLNSGCQIIQQGIYCLCLSTNLPNITVYFRGQKIQINSNNYMPYQIYDNLCRVCIYSNNYDYVILGLPFLLSSSVLFDKQNTKIGIYNAQIIEQIQFIYFIILQIIIGILILLIFNYLFQLIHFNSIESKTYDLELTELFNKYEN